MLLLFTVLLPLGKGILLLLLLVVICRFEASRSSKSEMSAAEAVFGGVILVAGLVLLTRGWLSFRGGEGCLAGLDLWDPSPPLTEEDLDLTYSLAIGILLGLVTGVDPVLPPEVFLGIPEEEDEDEFESFLRLSSNLAWNRLSRSMTGDPS